VRVNNKASLRVKIGYSVICLIIALVLAGWFVVPGGAANLAGDSLVGPGTWPRVMLLGIACCSALLLLRSALLYVEARRDPPVPATATAIEEFDNRKAALGISFLILYVAAMPLIGFALSTALFFLVWLPFGGVRRPRLVASIAVIGTVALLYTFVKLTTLPLDRGVGVFDSFTVSLYRLLAIY
jgi:Tripartite tricarboxylate transporter TctB family